MAIADACRRHERLRFDYTSPRGGPTIRALEPHSLVNFGRHWYLVAWDTERDDWRTFPRRPADRAHRPVRGSRPASLPTATWQPTCPTSCPPGPWPFQATVTLHESAESGADRVWPGMGVLEAIDEGRCTLHVGADTLSALVWMITSVDADFTLVHGPPSLAAALRQQATRCLQAL